MNRIYLLLSRITAWIIDLFFIISIYGLYIAILFLTDIHFYTYAYIHIVIFIIIYIVYHSIFTYANGSIGMNLLKLKYYGTKHHILIHLCEKTAYSLIYYTFFYITSKLAIKNNHIESLHFENTISYLFLVLPLAFSLFIFPAVNIFLSSGKQNLFDKVAGIYVGFIGKDIKPKNKSLFREYLASVLLVFSLMSIGKIYLNNEMEAGDWYPLYNKKHEESIPYNEYLMLREIVSDKYFFGANLYPEQGCFGFKVKKSSCYEINIHVTRLGFDSYKFINDIAKEVSSILSKKPDQEEIIIKLSLDLYYGNSISNIKRTKIVYSIYDVKNLKIRFVENYQPVFKQLSISFGLI